MTQIKNIKGLSADDINRELAGGGKFVMFQYCFSIIIMSFKKKGQRYLFY